MGTVLWEIQGLSIGILFLWNLIPMEIPWQTSHLMGCDSTHLYFRVCFYERVCFEWEPSYGKYKACP